jgi:hypothetical protein
MSRLWGVFVFIQDIDKQTGLYLLFSCLGKYIETLYFFLIYTIFSDPLSVPFSFSETRQDHETNVGHQCSMRESS